MDIERVRQFVEVMHSGSVTAAAKKLHISQPALSRSLRKFESEIGDQLFERTSNKLEPNALAHAIYGSAQELVFTERRFRDDVASARLHSRMLRVGGCAPAPQRYFAIQLIEHLPGTILSQEMFDEPGALLDRLREGSVDIAVLNEPAPGMKNLPFMRGNLFVSAPVEHPFARCEKLSFSDLGSETFVLYAGIGFWAEIHERLMPHALFIRQDDYEVYSELMRTSHALGFSSDAPVFASPSSAHDKMNVERVDVPITDPEAHASFYLVAREDTLERNEAVAKIFEDDVITPWQVEEE